MIRFYLSESFKSIKRAKLASFITVITLSIAIGFISFSLVLLVLSNRIERAWKSDIKVNVFLNDSLSTSQLRAIKSKIVKTESVKNVKYFSKEDAYKKFVQLTGNDFKKMLAINPLPRSYSVHFSGKINKELLKKIISKFEKINGVDDVVYDYNLTFSILDSIKSMKVFIYGFTILFVLISFYLLYSTSRIIISQKMIQINTMKLVGAKLSTLKIPILLTGLILGIVSAFLSMLVFDITYILFSKIYPQYKFDNYIYFINFGFVLLGVFLGPIGTGFFTKKISLKIENFK